MQRELEKRLSQALTICSEWDEWLEKCAQEITDELEHQHSECKARGREQLKVVRDLQQRVQASHDQLEANSEAHKRLLRGIELAQEELANINRWASDEDAEKLAAKVEQAQRNLREFLPKETAAFELNHRLAGELFSAQETMESKRNKLIRSGAAGQFITLVIKHAGRTCSKGGSQNARGLARR